jgi:thiamine biosynthesis lipoprotein
VICEATLAVRSMKGFPVRTEAVMGTLVTIQVVSDDSSKAVTAAIDRAFGWFHEIERRCSRFSQSSELLQLTANPGQPVPVSDILFEAVRFAIMVAEETDGAFDPTIGRQMEARGFNREFRTGDYIHTSAASDGIVSYPDCAVSYKDVELNQERRTITLRRPLTLDLGAVAKGLAIDTAARELAPFHDFAIDAGGDLYMGGLNPQGEPWTVGIRHPEIDGELLDSLRVSDQAVCTSGGYERPVPNNSGQNQHHILDPRTGVSPQSVSSATVVANGAMLADALATAAFVLGPDAGIGLLDRLGVEGLIFTRDLRRYETRGLRHA